MAYILLKIQTKKKVSLLVILNYFLNENNKDLKKKLAEADEYIKYLLDKLELLNK